MTHPTKRISKNESVRANVIANYRFAYKAENGTPSTLTDDAIEKIVVEAPTMDTAAEQDEYVLSTMKEQETVKEQPDATIGQADDTPISPEHVDATYAPAKFDSPDALSEAFHALPLTAQMFALSLVTFASTSAATMTDEDFTVLLAHTEVTHGIEFASLDALGEFLTQLRDLARTEDEIHGRATPTDALVKGF